MLYNPREGHDESYIKAFFARLAVLIISLIEDQPILRSYIVAADSSQFQPKGRFSCSASFSTIH